MPPVSELFRYSSRTYNTRLVEHGSLRVGTLHDFRKAEHKPGITDPSEGTRTISLPVKEWRQNEEIPGKPSDVRQALDMFGMFQSHNSWGNTLKGVTVMRPFDDPDCFVHCTSLLYSRTVMEQFSGAETCVRITNPGYFYAVLTHLINTEVMEVEPPILQKITYRSRQEIFDVERSKTPATFIKEEIFAPQVEFRAVWYPRDKTQILKPEILTSEDLARVCHEIPI
ncbi:hypothetical protein LU646_14570 [Pseudomonas alloputida]|uniref:hypothetical protein n=1 Tax=Pseudomonas alloputida TaxID=1940621 RepID=UPI001E5A71C8|nr:hypothetical protein [Pseudomonas alloputida]MCE1059102.1 hypothetical protein [Pseudomonas alloputida]